MTLNLFEIPVYVVSLRRSPERRERISKELTRIGLKDWSFFDAFDGTAMGLSTSVGTSRRSTAWPSPMTPGEIGCYLSHVALWRACAQQKSSVAIFEDDVIFAADFGTRFQEFLTKLPDACEAIQFGTSAKGMAEDVQPVEENGLLRHRGGTHELSGCIMSGLAMNWLVEHPELDKMAWPVDGFMHLLQKKFTVYGPLTRLVWQDYAFGTELEG